MSQEINNLVSALSENNFKILVREFNKKKYQCDDVRIVDGPWDGGNDLIIVLQDKEVKRNIQITVQKIGYESKLERDLEKAKENVNQFGYQQNLDFYINQNISKGKTNELCQHAEVTFNINLNIYDGNYFSQEIPKYDDLIHLLYKMHNIKTTTNSKFDKNSKIIFDVLTHNPDSVEIKKQFIDSFIFSSLYNQPNSTSDELFENINPLFNNSLDKAFFMKEISSLTSKRLINIDESGKKYSLSDGKIKEIDLLFSEVSVQEALLLNEIENCLLENNLNIDIDELITFLYQIYQDNYIIDIEEISNIEKNTGANSLRKSYEDLNTFFIRKGIPADNAQVLTRELLEICSANTFLNKLSAVHLFTNLYNSDKLEKYLNSREQEIIIDTQILIRLVCILYPRNYQFKDIALQSVKNLYDTLKLYKTKVEVITTFDYIEELTTHLIDAIKLRRFLDLPFVSQLGNSKNVFYNAYIELKNNQIINKNESILSFIGELIDEEPEQLNINNTSTLYNKVFSKMVELFEMLNYEIVRHSNYENFQKLKKQYEIELSHSRKSRSNTAIENDVRTALYLSDSEYYLNENGQIDEPFLVTWDSTFHMLRKSVLSDPTFGASYWYIYSPTKLVDRLCMMNFNLNPKSINSNIIALTENNFNYSGRTSSFIDVVSTFFNTDNLSELGILRKLAALNNTTRVEHVSSNENDFTDEDENPILKVLLNIRSHYSSSDTYQFKDVIDIFENQKFENEIVTILQSAMKSPDHFKIYEDLDLLISSSKDII